MQDRVGLDPLLDLLSSPLDLLGQLLDMLSPLLDGLHTLLDPLSHFGLEMILLNLQNVNFKSMVPLRQDTGLP